MSHASIGHPDIGVDVVRNVSPNNAVELAKNPALGGSTLPTASFPDVGNILDTFFGAERDYARDPIVAKAMEDGEKELDPAKRADILEKARNRATEMSYVLAVSSMPTVFAHSKDTEVRRDTLSAGDYMISDHYWK